MVKHRHMVLAGYAVMLSSTMSRHGAWLCIWLQPEHTDTSHAHAAQHVAPGSSSNRAPATAVALRHPPLNCTLFCVQSGWNSRTSRCMLALLLYFLHESWKPARALRASMGFSRSLASLMRVLCATRSRSHALQRAWRGWYSTPHTQ